MIKRAFDITFSLFGLILLLPFFIIIALLILLTMPGPVIYTQTRTGYRGKHFKLFKFRTMIVNNDPNVITIESDRRITPFGRFLRIAKFDELPQLWNILKGEMSFVGFRPDVPGYYDKLNGDDRMILETRPGLTGADSIAYTYEEIILERQDDPVKFYNEKLFPDKVRINKAYVMKQSFFLDIKIILFTIFGKQLKDEDFQAKFNIKKKNADNTDITDGHR